MARARNIKPAFFTNDRLAELSALTRLLLIGIWTIADKAGRLEDRARRIKAEVLPYDECDVEPMLVELARAGFIIRYDANGVSAIQVANWDKDQRPHLKEAESTIEPPYSFGASGGMSIQQALKASSATTCTSTESPPYSSGAQIEPSTDPGRGGNAPSTEFASLIPDSGSRMADCGSLISDAKEARNRAPLSGAEVDCPEDVDKQVWADWVRLRRSKRAPVTATVLEGARSEALKAEMRLQEFLRVWCVRGSQGLQADWLRPQDRSLSKTPLPRETFAERDERTARGRWAEAIGLSTRDTIVVDITPSLNSGRTS